MKKVYLIAISAFFFLLSKAQLPDTAWQLPYNRMIQSAGKVVTYGDPQLENHTLDITLLPGNQFLAIEDRYGIAIVNEKTKSLCARWSYAQASANKDLMSTYSGITAFNWQNKQYIVWGAAAKGKSFVMTAEWNGVAIEHIQLMKTEALAPATVAIPNQIAVNMEDGIPFLYVVLNGNNQLTKINFSNQEVVWTATTGVAPFGICIAGNKAFVSNWAGPLVTDTTREHAGTPWGSAYTHSVTGATESGSVSVIDIRTGKTTNEIMVGLHPNAIIKSRNNQYIYVANSNSDEITVLDAMQEKKIASVPVGLFADKQSSYNGSSPNALCLNDAGNTLYVANGMDNALAVISIAPPGVNKKSSFTVTGYIPTEAYPSGIALLNHQLYVTNLEARGAAVLSPARYDRTDISLPDGKALNAYTIHKQLASFSIIPVPDKPTLTKFTNRVKELALSKRIMLTNLPARKNIAPKPVPERIGEPTYFKHVIYIIKENKTYDQIYGDMKQGNGEPKLCIYGDSITPNQHRLSTDFSLLDNYFASGKSSAEGHQWTDAAMTSDYVEKNVRAWFRSYPHRQEDALVYNKNGFIWNNALDHGKKVRVFGEACYTHYDSKLKWLDLYNKQQNGEPIALRNTTTIARLRPVISPEYPDCDNFIFPDQLRANIFLKEWKTYEAMEGDQLPELIVLSLPDDHTSGTTPGFPVPRSMVADNDYALGRIVEAITHSRFWDSTVIFVTEDDSQTGWDHVSSYRTTGLVLSPYSVMNKTVHKQYNQTSIVRTIEQILGLPPMNVIDATAEPMFDCFTGVKKPYQYNVIPNKVPLNEMNKPYTALRGRALEFAKLSATVAFKELDGGEDDLMNQILWFDAKGEEPFPVVYQKKKK